MSGLASVLPQSSEVETLVKVFDIHPEEDRLGTSLSLANLPQILKYRLDLADEKIGWGDQQESEKEAHGGRLGPALVGLEMSSEYGAGSLFNYTRARSNCNFYSVRANTCVYQGRWMYEVTLVTAGVQQIGWCLRDTRFTSQVMRLSAKPSGRRWGHSRQLRL